MNSTISHTPQVSFGAKKSYLPLALLMTTLGLGGLNACTSHGISGSNQTQQDTFVKTDPYAQKGEVFRIATTKQKDGGTLVKSLFLSDDQKSFSLVEYKFNKNDKLVTGNALNFIPEFETEYQGQTYKVKILNGNKKDAPLLTEGQRDPNQEVMILFTTKEGQGVVAMDPFTGNLYNQNPNAYGDFLAYGNEWSKNKEADNYILNVTHFMGDN